MAWGNEYSDFYMNDGRSINLWADAALGNPHPSNMFNDAWIGDRAGGMDPRSIDYFSQFTNQDPSGILGAIQDAENNAGVPPSGGSTPGGSTPGGSTPGGITSPWLNQVLEALKHVPAAVWVVLLLLLLVGEGSRGGRRPF